MIRGMKSRYWWSEVYKQGKAKSLGQGGASTMERALGGGGGAERPGGAGGADRARVPSIYPTLDHNSPTETGREQCLGMRPAILGAS